MPTAQEVADLVGDASSAVRQSIESYSGIILDGLTTIHTKLTSVYDNVGDSVVAEILEERMAGIFKAGKRQGIDFSSMDLSNAAVKDAARKVIAHVLSNRQSEQ